ncbi:SLATT domain-containing protein [Streptomyces lydicus]|uniref:SLATT domain-containing protein n=1 Tax=Streptomyces lydicus TaxID=47763 RepID=UPI0037ACFB6A
MHSIVKLIGLIGVPLLLLSLIGATALTWRRYDMAPINTFGFVVAVALGIGCLAFIENFDTGQPWFVDDNGDRLQHEDSVAELKLDLDLAEEKRVLAASKVARAAFDRQYSYRDAIPREIDRLRGESASYRRWHNLLQWTLIIFSAAITGVTALYDTPQPGKGILIGLGGTVTVITSVMGYFKFKERGFNLQQTADAIEQHVTALDLAIAPYNLGDEKENLRLFAENVEALRVEQRKREQQLDQPHQGQQEIV